MKTGWKNNIHKARQKLKQLGGQALSLILPRSCVGCRKSNESFCENCQTLSYKTGAQCLICGQRNNSGIFCKNCRPQGSALKNVLWAGRYDGALREAVRQLKYRRRKELAKPLGNLLCKKFKEIFPEAKSENFAIIPIPLHFKKEHERGFNQAGLLAQEFSKLSHIPLLTNSLLKVKETPAQVEVKDKEKRIKNLEGAFEVKLPPLAPPCKGGDNNKKLPSLIRRGLGEVTIILIDDVATTGATLAHASEALSKAGARKIIGLVAAHG